MPGNGMQGGFGLCMIHCRPGRTSRVAFVSQQAGMPAPDPANLVFPGREHDGWLNDGRADMTLVVNFAGGQMEAAG